MGVRSKISGGRAYQKLIWIAGTFPTAFRIFDNVRFFMFSDHTATDIIFRMSHCIHILMELLISVFSLKSNDNLFLDHFFCFLQRHFVSFVIFFSFVMFAGVRAMGTVFFYHCIRTLLNIWSWWFPTKYDYN